MPWGVVVIHVAFFPHLGLGNRRSIGTARNHCQTLFDELVKTLPRFTKRSAVLEFHRERNPRNLPAFDCDLWRAGNRRHLSIQVHKHC